jgi:acetylornithine deacetylase/succinyl-diaminopimelate desuccinylase-like protein
MVAIAGSDDPDRCLLLAAHLDTHALGDGWTADPLGGDGFRDGRLVGRGSTDIKGAAAAMAVAFAQAVRRGLPAGVRLLFAGNADEETGGLHGWQAVLDEWDERPHAAVVAEPSGVDDPWEALYVGARGGTRFTLHASGEGTHSSLAGRPGVDSALERIDAALAALRALPLCRDHDPRWGPRGRLTVVRCEGGDGWGRVPAAARAEVEIRLAPGAEQVEVEAEVLRAVAGSDATLEWAPGGLRWIGPSAVPEEHPLVAAGAAAWRAALGSDPVLACFPGGTDARLLQDAGIPSLIAGPGALRRAHHPDEYVTADELHDAVRLYSTLLDQLLDER